MMDYAVRYFPINWVGGKSGKEEVADFPYDACFEEVDDQEAISHCEQGRHYSGKCHNVALFKKIGDKWSLKDHKFPKRKKSTC